MTKLINIIDSKDPKRLTFMHKYKPLAEDVEQAMQSLSFMRGIIEDGIHDDDMSEEAFNLLEYIRLVLADNLDASIDKANYFARAANHVLSEESN